MHLNKDQVKKVAKLASLSLGDAEQDLYSRQISEILDYMDELNEIDTDGVNPTYNISKNENIFRKDEVGNSLSRDMAIKNSHNIKNGFFVTKGVFKES